MKFTKLAVAVGLACLASTASAGVWEKLSTMNDPVAKPTARYNVEAAAWNVRVVEWVPAENPSYRCMFVGGSEKGGASCYPATQKQK